MNNRIGEPCWQCKWLYDRLQKERERRIELEKMLETKQDVMPAALGWKEERVETADFYC